MKIHHKKIKNTGLLFELLAKQIAEDVLNNKKSKAIEIVKEYFKKGTELNKELGLYQTLINQKYNNEILSNQFIDAVLEERKKLNTTVLKNQKYNLVKALKENYVIEDFINGRTNNYKILASIYKLFESCTTNNIVNPIEKIDARHTLVEYISSKNIKKNDTSEIEKFKNEDKDLRLLAQKLLIEKFNKKYTSVLNEKQKTLLKEYISNISNSNNLKIYINNELINIKNDIKKYMKNVEDDVIPIKLNEIIHQMDEIEKDKIVKEEYLIRIMRYYQLIDELKNVKK